ncbi:tRNA lysidine(34) synthetase TilS [Shewanella psychrotolerans]|uniref:tRNA lysidine(34) synthetase TilS n=1 Tax=Shewanella psychrotolerans TaxID=2864206 RepID=UPI001C65A811|nr:tRNA lysidine(34) synthetase TilS [Shewanella psychrotolerans]QYK02536.1 tRNA lysidine(34) synthetase TilS [Shewanella psychrotolerans]
METPSFSPATKIAALIEQLGPAPETKLVLAYSGGVDSQVLAAGLAEFAQSHPELNYLLVHVHHGLSANAAQWAKHCELMADQYGLPIKVKQVKVESGPRVSIEAAARDARYAALTQELSAGDLLLTAHHQDDQLETLLLALKRGLGPKGLAAMGQLQVFAEHAYLVRPLLDVQRQEIEEYAKLHHIAHIEDESNQDNRFDRNFLRLDVIPALKARWPAIAATVSRSAQLCAEQQALIDDEVGARLPGMIVKIPNLAKPVLDLRLLAQHSELWRAQLLRGFIDSLGFAMPSSVQLKQILSQLLLAKEDAKVEIRLKSMVLRRFRHHLYIDKYQPSPKLMPKEIAISDNGSQGWEIANNIKLNASICDEGVRLRLPQSNELVSIRFGASGAIRCHPHFRDKGRELKKLWQELAVPPWLRDQVPLIYFNDKLVAAVGYWVEKRFIALGTDVGLRFEMIKSVE